eukprot:jgi/Mesvir1/1510/Mv14493-RA.1
MACRRKAVAHGMRGAGMSRAVSSAYSWAWPSQEEVARRAFSENDFTRNRDPREMNEVEMFDVLEPVYRALRTDPFQVVAELPAHIPDRVLTMSAELARRAHEEDPELPNDPERAWRYLEQSRELQRESNREAGRFGTRPSTIMRRMNGNSLSGIRSPDAWKLFDQLFDQLMPVHPLMQRMRDERRTRNGVLPVERKLRAVIDEVLDRIDTAISRLMNKEELTPRDSSMLYELMDVFQSPHGSAIVLNVDGIHFDELERWLDEYFLR